MLELSLDINRITHWLTELETEYYQCQHCQGLHIVRVQQSSDVSDAKLDFIDDVISYRIIVELRQSTIATLIAELSLINAASPILKIFLDIQDDGAPKLVIMHSISCSEGLSRKQFAFFMQQVEEEALQVVSELRQCEMLANTQSLTNENVQNRQTYH